MVCVVPSLCFAFDHQYVEWSKILKTSVTYNKENTKSKVDYNKIDLSELNVVVDNLLKTSKKDLRSFRQSQKLAFFINLYNALTLRLIKSHYKELKEDGNSIKSLRKGFPSFTSPWNQKLFTLFGKESTLDEIEHGYIRGAKSGFDNYRKQYNDPRIHFAVNCASIGCPALQDHAFTADHLNQQLEAAQVNFLKDRSRNYIDEKKKTIYLSKIFDWYKDDFKKGLRGYHSLIDFIVKNQDSLALNESQKKLIQSKQFKIEYTDYNWQLNDQF